MKGYALSLLDITVDEFDELYYTNEKLFKSVTNWFYFANDKKVSVLSTKGYVCYGRNRGRKRSFGWPEDDFGGLVLLCRSDANIGNIRTKFAEEKNSVVRFELKDGTKAHYGLLKDPAGACGPEGAEYPLLIVPNNPQTRRWPYSMKGSTTFDKASKEEGTLPFFVATGEIEKLLPGWVKEDLGLIRI